MTEKEKATDIQTQPYQAMDTKDEEQILAELKGEFLEQFVYQYQQGNRTITSLSYTGIKEAIRRRGNFSITDYKVEETEDKYRAIVKVHDNEKHIDALGASEADKSKPFAYVLALNKAERNAYAKLIPAKFFAELIAEKLKSPKQRSDAKVVDATPEQKPTEDAPLMYRLEAEIPPQILSELNIEEYADKVTLKPKTRLETEDFKQVCKIIEGFNGHYDKLQGYWEVPL